MYHFYHFVANLQEIIPIQQSGWLFCFDAAGVS
jgi:hypothetical protein